MRVGSMGSTLALSLLVPEACGPYFRLLNAFLKFTIMESVGIVFKNLRAAWHAASAPPGTPTPICRGARYVAALDANGQSLEEKRSLGSPVDRVRSRTRSEIKSMPVFSGAFRNSTRGWTYKRGLSNGSAPAGTRGRAPEGLWGRSRTISGI